MPLTDLARHARAGLIAAICAADLLAPLPATAQVFESDDLLALFGTVAVAALIADAIEDDKKNKQEAPGYGYGYGSGYGYGNPAGWHDDRDDDRRYGRRLPSECAVSYGGAAGRGTVYLGDCLREAGYDRHLPRECAASLRTGSGKTRIYDAECLREAGFRTGRYGH